MGARRSPLLALPAAQQPLGDEGPGDEEEQGTRGDSQGPRGRCLVRGQREAVCGGGQRCHCCDQTSPPAPSTERQVTAMAPQSWSQPSSCGDLASNLLSPLSRHGGRIPRDVCCSPAEGPIPVPPPCRVSRPPWPLRAGSVGRQGHPAALPPPQLTCRARGWPGLVPAASPCRRGEGFGVQTGLGTPLPAPESL